MTKHWGLVDRSVMKQHCECHYLSLGQARQSCVLPGKLSFLEREGNNRAENRDPNAYVFILSSLLSGFVSWNKRPITVAKLGTGAKRCDSPSANRASHCCVACSASRSQYYTRAQEQGTAHTQRSAGEAITLIDLPKFSVCPPANTSWGYTALQGCPFLPAAPRGSQSRLGAGNHRSAWARARASV